MALKTFAVLSAAMLIGGCSGADQKPAPSQEEQPSAPSHQQIKRGNGEHNYIILEDAKRDGAIFTFKEVAIDAPGWLVTHPFENGEPVATVYTGATSLAKGVSKNVQIEVSPEPSSGAMMIVMLHYDVNEDGVFDFNDGVTVPDAPGV